MQTIRKNATSRLSKLVEKLPVLAVFKGDGYYPIERDVVMRVIREHRTLLSSAILDDSGRLTLDITDRSLGQYIVALPSLEYAKTHLYPKDFARLHPDNQLAGRQQQSLRDN